MTLTEMQQRVVLVTGASRGIGLGVASAFAAAGATVHLIADDPHVEQAAAGIGAAGHVADITRSDEVARVLAQIERLDVLVNNAGLERMTPVDDASAENQAVFRRVVEINVVGTFIVTSLAVQKLGAGGRIINTASIWGRVGEPLFGAYVASKHAVLGLTKTWAKELGPRGITVNAVCPGWVKTDAALWSLHLMSERAGEKEDVLLAKIMSAQALPGLMQPKDVAGPYLFLASELAANVTGQSLGVDRGEVPW